MSLDFSVKGANERNTKTRKLQTGIHEKLQFLPTEVKSNFIQFQWAAPNGDYQEKRIFFPDPVNYPATRRKDKQTGDYMETQEQADQRRVDDSIRDMADYLELCYTPQEVEEKVKGNSFEQLCHVVAKMLNDKRESFYINLKVIPTSDLQYTEVPRFQGGYIELWREGIPSTLKFSQYELERINTLSEPAPSTDDAVAPQPNLFS